MARVQLAVAACLSCAVASQVDVGYELLYKDALDEYDAAAPLTFRGGLIPDYVRGTFLQTGPARWSWKHNDTFTRHMTHILDGYSKLHKWEFRDDGSVWFSSRFLRSGFWAESEQQGDIPFGVMAQPTEPPLPKPGMKGFLKAPNDNNNVNVIQLGGLVQVLSDTATLVEVDMGTLGTVAEYNGQFCNTQASPCSKLNMSNPFMQVCGGGSAHPHMAANGDYIGLRETVKEMGVMQPGHEHLSVYRISANNRATAEDLVTVKVPRSSYTHSFGLAKPNAPGGEEHVIIAQQPLHYNALALMRSGTLQEGLQRRMGESTLIHVAPLRSGAKVTTIDSKQTFFFGHFINSYEEPNGTLVADINIQDDTFFDRYSIAVQTDKQARDAWPTQQASGSKNSHGYETATRFRIDPVRGELLSAEPLFGRPSPVNIENEHDLFRLHPADYGRPYCGYWAWQAYYQSSSFASWAIVRTELCGSAPKVAAAWYRPNVYPGEAAFIPKPGSADKTEGVLIFKALDGNSGKSLLIIADAASLATVAEAELPVHVPYTVHGNWFPSRRL